MSGRSALRHVSGRPALLKTHGASVFQPAADSTDVVLRYAGTVVVVSASWIPTTTEWASILSGMASTS